jgi:hypothetical protein
MEMPATNDETTRKQRVITTMRLKFLLRLSDAVNAGLSLLNPDYGIQVLLFWCLFWSLAGLILGIAIAAKTGKTKLSDDNDCGVSKIQQLLWTIVGAKAA